MLPPRRIPSLHAALLVAALAACAGRAPAPGSPVSPPQSSDFDRDGDGLVDRLDRCPDEPEDVDGFEDEDGCTDVDNDKDGVPDLADKCPNEPEDKDGFRDRDGCTDPDNDGDGITDRLDRCPDESEVWNGVDDEDGCPDRGRVLIRGCGWVEILDKIFFPSGSARVSSESVVLLDAITATLRASPELALLEVSGHTDGHGRHERSRQLSAARAMVIRDYLVTHGVAARRLRVVGLGSTRPICSEVTEECRAKNRRVEFQTIKRVPEPEE